MRSLSLALTVCLFACTKASTVSVDAGPAPSASTVASASPSATASATVVEMPTDTEKLAAASNAFGVDLWRRAAPAGKNFALSPASVSAALAMTWGGAKGETERQMRAALHLEGPQDAVSADWGRLSRALASPSRKLELRVANRLFGEKTFTFEKPFLERTKTDWDAPFEPVDFVHGADAARVHINGWVASQTKDKIKDLLPERSIDESTRLVLVDAIYFLASWLSPFEENATSDGAFHVAPGQSKNVPTMHQTHGFRWVQRDGMTMLELPYKGDDASMWIVLPDRADGLADVEKGLTAAKLAAWRSALEWKQVEVALPKFEVHPGTLGLAGALGELGIKDAFDANKADFTAIGVPPDPRMRLYIANAYHQTFVKVDEKGTEAAAATAVVMAVGGGPPPKPIAFHADHPFLFFVVDKASGMVLFMGRVTDPSTKT